jgi:predicted transcriptional regulator
MKTGEAAHIVGENPSSARYQKVGKGIAQAAENGLWLCATCHTKVDKNNGADYSIDDLLHWKRQHEELVLEILDNHQTPLPLMRKHSINASVAQGICDLLSNHGVMYQHQSLENDDLVINSIETIRKTLSSLLKGIQNDKELRYICNALIHSCRDLMNDTSKDKAGLYDYLPVLRLRSYALLRRLKDEYGCNIQGPITAYV